MLTTLDIDDDVLASARTLAEQRHQSIDRVISELARYGLAPAIPAVRNGIRLFPVRENVEPVTPELIKDLLEESV